MAKPSDTIRLSVTQSFSAEYGEGLDLELVCQSRLRHLPGRRTVWKCSLSGQEFLLKLYYPHRKQQRDFAREWGSADRLIKAGLETPKLLFNGKTDDGLLVVGYEFLSDAKTVYEVIEGGDDDVKQSCFNGLLEMHARQHAAGCYQSDNHLNNYMVKDGKLSMVDAAAFVFGEAPLPIPERAKNLAHLKANISLPQRRYYETVFPGYAKLCQQDVDLDELRVQIENFLPAAVKARFEEYYKKTYERRLSADFERVAEDDKFWLACQGIDSTLKQKLLDDPNQFFSDDCEVVEVNEGGKTFLLKRFYPKSLKERLFPLARFQPALRGWSNGHTLRSFDVPTPRPEACLLLKKSRLLQASYLLIEKVSGQPMGDAKSSQYEQRCWEIDALGGSSSETGPENFIANDHGSLVIVDLERLQFL